MKKLTAWILTIILLLTVVPIQKAQAASANDRYYYLQWALKNDGTFSQKSRIGDNTAVAGIDINVETAWDLYTPVRGVTVALIDTGVDLSNPDLYPHVWTNPGEIEGNGIDDDHNGYVDDVHGWNFRSNNNTLLTPGQDSHGTHCFSTISADYNSTGVAGICGVTNAVDIMVIKVFDGSEGKSSDIVKGIQYAESNGAKIVNLSLGLDQYNYELYRVMKNSSMLFVCAAGNSGNNSDVNPIYPAAFDLDNVISVANICCDGSLASSSNYGAKTIDIGAPGTNIIGHGVDGKMYYMTGTSMATPMVTAAAALLYTDNATCSLSDVKAAILNSAKPVSYLSSTTLTGGMLDIGSAIKLLSTGQSPVEEPETPEETDDPNDTNQSSENKEDENQDVNITVNFKDVNKTDWFYTYVGVLSSKGIVNGYNDQTFRPRNNITNGEVLKLIMLSAGYEEQAKTDSHWASGYRDLAISNNIVNPDEVSNLDSASKRLMIGQTVAKALNLQPDYTASPFKDVSDPYLTALYNYGIIEGSIDAQGNRLYKPNDNIVRSEICAIVYRMLNK